MRSILVFLGCITTTLVLAAPDHALPAVKSESRQKRWIPRFPYNSCYALAVVMAIPLELKGRNVYMSWNFETNYYFPYFDNVQGLVPLPFATITQDDTNQGTILYNARPADEDRKLDGHIEQIVSNKTESSESVTDTDNSSRTDSSPESIEAVPEREDNNTNQVPVESGRRASREILDHFMTRARFYKIIESKMISYGMNGRKCLQKAICDVAANSIQEHNGVIGDIVHIIFTPSASKDEHLPRDLNEAELHGKAGNCQQYHERCPTSILDAISMFA